ncbi:MAG: hypothetical protein AMXMBFR12_09090 [Candidatus Babeliales bacterium]
MVNNEWIFRFAQNYDARAHMHVEVALLKELENKMSFAIPRVAYYFPHSYCFGYRKIHGVSLTKESYFSFNELGKKQLCDDLSRFLVELENCVSIADARKIGLPTADWPMASIDLNKKLTHLEGTLKTIFDNVIDRYALLEKDTELVAVVHNDLHGDNILIDDKTGKLIGIIDFSSTAIGSIYHEFRYLHLIDISLVEQVVEAYSKLSGKQLNTQDAYAYCLATEFSRLVQAQERNNTQKVAAISQRIMNLVTAQNP